MRRSPLQLTSRLAARRELRVLAYHDVRDAVTFEQQLDYVLDHYTPVRLDQVLAAARGGSLPTHAVLITFDDGHRSWIDHVIPAMQQREVPGVVFVASGVVGSSEPYWWDQVVAQDDDADRVIAQMKRIPDDERLRLLDEMRQRAVEPLTTDTHLTKEDLVALDAAGLEVGNHTVTHPMLDRCAPGKVVQEVRAAKEALEDIVGREIRCFAYPNGNTSPAARQAVGESGHAMAFLFDHSVQPWPPPDVLAVSRIRVNAHDALDTFAIRVSGLHSTIHRYRGR